MILYYVRHGDILRLVLSGARGSQHLTTVRLDSAITSQRALRVTRRLMAISNLPLRKGPVLQQVTDSSSSEWPQPVVYDHALARYEMGYGFAGRGGQTEHITNRCFYATCHTTFTCNVEGLKQGEGGWQG